MQVNNIQNSYQSKQNFGMAMKTPKPDVVEYLTNIFKGDSKAAKKYMDTFEKVQKQQANNPLYDMQINTSNGFIVEVVKKGKKDPITIFEAPGGMNINVKSKEVKNSKNAKSIIKTLKTASNFATEQAEVDKILSKKK